MQTRSLKEDRKKVQKTTPDLLGSLKRGPGRPPRPAMNALQIADCFEAEAKKLQAVADILRGTT